MATETDVYLIKTDEAVANLKALTTAQETVKATAVQTGEAAAASYFRMDVALQAAKQAAMFLLDVMKDSAQAFMDQERADRMLLQVAGPLTEAFKAQASALQATLGVSDDMVEGLQTMALRMGAAPKQVEPLVKAVLDLAAATGDDATTAMRKLISGVENGGESLKKLGIRYESAGRFTEDLNRATEALAKTFGGAAATNADTVAGRMEILKGQVGETKEAFGQFLFQVEAKLHILQSLSTTFNAINKELSGESKNDRNKERWTKALHEMEGMLTTATGAAREKLLADIANQRKQLGILNQEATKGVIPADAGGGRDHAVGKAHKAKEDDTAKHFAEMLEFEKKYQKGVEEMDQHALEQQIEHDADALEQLQDTTELFLKQREKLDDQLGGMWEVAGEDLQKDIERRAEAIQTALDSITNSVEQVGGILVDLAMEQYGEMILHNEEFTKAYKEKSLERRFADQQEGDIHKTVEQLKSEADEEEVASRQKKTAEVLATISQEAVKQAIFQGAAAIAAAAEFNYPGAALHAAAAAAFGAVAIGTGVAAAGVSSGRGFTADEKGQLEGLEKREKTRSARESKQSGQSGNAIGTQVIVYQIGITGQTRTAQGRELAKLQREYGALEVGSPGG